MFNKAMEAAIAKGTCVDVATAERVDDSCAGFHGQALDITDMWQGRDADVDYCDSRAERWIWSIGVSPDGRVLAAFDSRFYQRTGYECVFLR